jgi:uncharacterized membrane protein YfcA
MSETVTSAVPSAAIVAQQSNDSLLSPQFILAGFTMAIVAGTVSAVLMHGDDGNIKLVLGFVFGMGSGVGAFYFGSSKSSQAKDAVLAEKITPAPGTTTTTTTPATVVVTPAQP